MTKTPKEKSPTEQGLRKGLTSYGDKDFSLFYAKHLLKAQVTPIAH